jgi:DNA adenine methylase
LLKWVGNKQRFAHEIVGAFPKTFNRYFEPFLGSGAVLATLSPRDALASDIFSPLVEIWFALKNNPQMLKKWYEERWKIAHGKIKKEGYERQHHALQKSAANLKGNEHAHEQAVFLQLSTFLVSTVVCLFSETLHTLKNC